MRRIRRLVMLRHGQTEYNAGSRMQGQLDTDLSDLGRHQAVAAAEVLAKRRPLAIVSSDLRRALDTAVVLGEHAGMPVIADIRLRETHLGEWQGDEVLSIPFVVVCLTFSNTQLERSTLP
ncbi:histidine phosphatase family protein, partial [Mycolicibacterium novocastrense]